MPTKPAPTFDPGTKVRHPNLGECEYVAPDDIHSDTEAWVFVGDPSADDCRRITATGLTKVADPSPGYWDRWPSDMR